MDWGILAATTATYCGKKLAELGVGTAWRDKVEPAFRKSGLDHELARGFEAGFRGFVAVLRGPFDVDDTMDARLREMFADTGFQGILAELPRARFEDIDDTRARELFYGLGLPGASDAVFEVAWAALGRYFHAQIAQTEHASKLVELTQRDRIEGYLARLAEAVGPRRDESAALAAYRRYVYNLYRLADTRGLFWREKETVGEEIELASIFIETLLRRKWLGPRIETPTVYESEDATVKAVLDIFEGAVQRVDLAPSAEPRKIADVLAAERRLVVLGPPGSGKTTLMRCLALALAASDDDRRPLKTGLPDSTLPLLLPLRTYAARLREQSALKLDAFLKDELGSDLGDLDAVLESGQALVLLDGLDEVFDETHRRWVSEEVWRLMSRHSGARFVVSSRPHGYEAAELPGAVPVYEMEPFDGARIGRFFRGWFAALATQGLDMDRDYSPEERAAALTRDVLARPRIRALAENPMLSTLIVLVHRSRSGHLPERRVRFYEAAVSVLAEHWERLKRYPDQRFEFPEPETVFGVLSEVAWRAQTELGGREIPAETLESWMLDALAQDPEWTDRRQRAVKDFLKVVEQRTGLLLDAGAGRYQFAHLSLQEFLVSHYLLARLGESQCSRVVRYFLHVPEWEEILRLTIGGAQRAQAENLVRSILDEPSSEWEDQICRDLQFVCRCFEDRPDVGEAVRAEVRRRWLEALREPYADEAGLIVAGIGLGLTPETRTAVEERLGVGDVSVRKAAVEYFVKLGGDDKPTQNHFRGLLERGGWIRRPGDSVAAPMMDKSKYSAAEYFARVYTENEEARANLEARLLCDDDLRHLSVEEIAEVDADSVAARDFFWTILEEGNDWHLAAIKYLKRIQVGDERVRDAVKSLLEDGESYVRSSAIEYFQEIRATDEEIRSAVEARLDDEDEFVRLRAIEYLMGVGANDSRARSAVEARLDDESGLVRGCAVDYFAKFDISEERMRAAVERLLEDKDWRVWSHVAEYFSTVGIDISLEALEARLTAPSESARVLAITVLVERGLSRQNASAVLDAFAGAQNSTSWRIDDKLSYSIGRLAATDDSLLKRIVEQRIDSLDLAIALRAAADRRDELRRQRTSLSDVLTEPALREQPTPKPEPGPSDPVKITRLEVTDLRILEDLAVDLIPGTRAEGQWTLLLGDNAVGKTTLLRAITLACVEEQTAAALLEMTGLSAPFVRHGAEKASVSVKASTGDIRYSISPNATSERLHRSKPQKVLSGPVFAYGCQRGTAFGGPDRDVDFKSLDNVGTLFDDNAHLIHAETWLLKMRLAANGAGPRRSFFEAVHDTLVATLPGVKSLDVDEDAQIWLDGPKVGKAPLAAMSDGYVTTVGWIVDLIARWAERNRLLGVELDGDFRKEMTGLVLIDEIDLHLHPLWQVEIVSTLRQQFPRLSFIATTHNPLTLLGARDKEIWLLHREPDSGRVLARQRDIPAGASADDILTGEWFGLASTLDLETQGLLDEHRGMLRRGVSADNPKRQRLEAELRRRLGAFPATSLERMVQGIAAELIGDEFPRTPEGREQLRRKILERARQKREEQSP